MTLLQRARQEHSRSGFIETKRESAEHYDDGSRHVDCANYEGSVFTCACGEGFIEKSELVAHIAEHKPVGASLFLSWWSDHSGTLYEVRHGLYGGKTILSCFVSVLPGWCCHSESLRIMKP